jgi:hypothetical protein
MLHAGGRSGVLCGCTGSAGKGEEGCIQSLWGGLVTWNIFDVFARAIFPSFYGLVA